MTDTRKPTDRLLAASGLAVLCAVTPAAAAGRAAPVECRPEPARTETLEGVGPRGEIRLTSGARAVLGSLRWPEAEAASEKARAWVEARRGASLTLTPRGPPDRWGRERVDAEDEAAGLDLAGGLIAAGLAFADAGEVDTLCRPGLRTVEAAARGRRLGIWSAPPPDAGDGAALRALAGRFVVVEGLVRHVGERSARTYLDFAARGADGLTVTVAKRTWRMMRMRGLSAESLRGRRVRVRGIMDVRRGPTLEAASAEAVEVLEATVPEDAVVEDSVVEESGSDRGSRR